MSQEHPPPAGESARTHAQDRRKEPRYPPATDLAHIGWCEGEEFCTVQAQLQNISNGGAALDLARDRPASPDLWMCVVTAGPTEWLQASIAGSQATEDGGQRVRLAFVEPCPYDVFKAVVWGLTLARPAPPPTPTEPRRAETTPSGRVGQRTPHVDSTNPRPAPDPSYDDEFTSVVVALPVIPSRWKVEQDRRAAADRVAILPWALTFLLSVFVITLLGILVIERWSDVRNLASLEATSERATPPVVTGKSGR